MSTVPPYKDNLQTYKMGGDNQCCYLNSCPHTNQVTTLLRKNCFHCGCHVPFNQDCQAITLYRSSYLTFMDVTNYEKSLDKNKPKEINVSPDSLYKKQRKLMIDWIFNLSCKLHFSLNTSYLATYYTDLFLTEKKVPNLDFQLYATVAVLLAAKAIELDERIPYIPKLRQYAMSLFKIEDIKRGEAEMLAFLDWKLQKTTLVDYIQYFLSQGILFTNDEIIKERSFLALNEKNSNDIFKNEENNGKSCNNLKVLEQKFGAMTLEAERIEIGRLAENKKADYIRNLEKIVYTTIFDIIADINFLDKNTKFLAGACIAYARKSLKLLNSWNEELTMISEGMKYEDFEGIVAMITNKYEVIQYRKEAIKNQNEIKRGEGEMLAFLDWKLQKTTLVDYIQYFLSQGILFTNDEIIREERNFLALKEKNSNDIFKSAENNGKSCNNLKVLEQKFGEMTLEAERIEIGRLAEDKKADYIRNLERIVYTTTFDIITDIHFMDKNTKFLAGACIAYARKSLKLLNSWNEELTMISEGMKYEDFEGIIAMITNKYEFIQYQKETLKNQNEKIKKEEKYSELKKSSRIIVSSSSCKKSCVKNSKPTLIKMSSHENVGVESKMN